MLRQHFLGTENRPMNKYAEKSKRRMHPFTMRCIFFFYPVSWFFNHLGEKREYTFLFLYTNKIDNA